MAVTAARAGAVLLLLTAIVPCSDAPPPRPLQLRLTLAKDRWRVGEYLWYRLEARNTGRRTLQLSDRFWIDQRGLEENLRHGRGVYLDVRREDGRPASWTAELLPGEPFWSNDLHGFTPPEILSRPQEVYFVLESATPKWLFQLLIGWTYRWIAKGPVGVVELQPGKSFIATPSRYRQGAWASPTVPGILWGAPSADFVPPARAPAGFRILAERWLGPGRYTMRAILDEGPTLPAASAEEEIQAFRRMWLDGEARPEWIDRQLNAIRSRWAAKSPSELAALEVERRRIFKARASSLRVESNRVAFEILP